MSAGAGHCGWDRTGGLWGRMCDGRGQRECLGRGGDVEAMQAVCWNVRGKSLRAQQGSRGEVRLLV